MQRNRELARTLRWLKYITSVSSLPVPFLISTISYHCRQLKINIEFIIHRQFASSSKHDEPAKLSAHHRRRRRFDPLTPPPPPSSLPSYNGHPNFNFKIIHKSKKSGARVGRIETAHGAINTPGFVAVATNGALKALDFSQADAEGLELAFCNTYHLMLHPGADAVEYAGGLHAFTGRRRDRPFITDSGGFQVFSLKYGTVHEELTSSLKRSTTGSSNKHRRAGDLVVKVSEEGVVFKSYRDGTRMLLSPETSVAAQKSLGADIILPLDELPPYHIGEQALVHSVFRSHRWEARR